MHSLRPLKGTLNLIQNTSNVIKEHYLTAQRCKLDSNTPAQRFIRPTILRTYLRSIEKKFVYLTYCELDEDLK